MKKIIDSGEEWTWEKLEWIYGEIEKVAEEVMGITKNDIYPNQIEIVSFEQMLDAYSRHGMPLGYDHWSIGESFVKQAEAYKHRQMGLAFEIVLNCSPTINYLMEQNVMGMQALVLAHAAIGHNWVFKNNYLFREWTDAEGIIDYLLFAKRYVKSCEEKYGAKEVEKILDAAHALQYHGVDRYRRPSKLSAAEEEKRRDDRERYLQSQLNEIWNTLPAKKTDRKERSSFIKEPQENLLYFLEKNAPRLESWHREILRIVRKIAQYFHPQIQTKVLNEGFATFTHHTIMEELYNRRFLTDGAMKEFYASHTNVIYQPDQSSLNPYTLGFNILRDVKRISLNPTDEDAEWFKHQDWVGNGKPYENIKRAVSWFKDDSFILQHLSPKVIRDMKLFALHDDDDEDYVEISGIHNEYGYDIIRKKLSNMYDINNSFPNIQVVDVDIWGDRTMVLEHRVSNRRMLHDESTEGTLAHLAYLWQYPVVLQAVDNKTDKILYEWESEPSLSEAMDFNLSDL